VERAFVRSRQDSDKPEGESATGGVETDKPVHYKVETGRGTDQHVVVQFPIASGILSADWPAE